MTYGLTPHKTRLAPTPSGYLHVGNVLSFAITTARAAQMGAQVLLRIDDMDRPRVDRCYVEDIFETLDFLQIPWHEGPKNYTDFEGQYSQAHRMGLYAQALDELLQLGCVYSCTCSRARLHALNSQGIPSCGCRERHLPPHQPDATWRLITDPHAELTVRLSPTGTTRAVLPGSMAGFVVRKKDGSPAYQLATVIDDLHYGITHIVRGLDLWESTLAQHYLAQCLGSVGFGDIVFHHHPLLLGDDGIKLSKSAGATSIQYLRAQGTPPADVYRLIAAQLGYTEAPSTALELGQLYWLYSAAGASQQPRGY